MTGTLPTLLRHRVMKIEDGVRKYLLTNFAGSEQLKDLDKTKGNIKGSINDFFRVKTNLKDYQLDEYFTTKNNQVLPFDMDFWAIDSIGAYNTARLQDVPREVIEEYTNVFIYQLKGCNMNCKFCFVDRFNNNGIADHGAEYFSMHEIIDSFIKFRERKNDEGIALNQFRPSGGEPTLAPEQWLEVLQLLEEYGLSNKVSVQSDCNGTTGHAWNKWIKNKEMQEDLFEQVGKYKNFNILYCFKGSDPDNLARNVGRNAEQGRELLEEQLYTFKKLLSNGIKTYAFVINPNPETLEGFMNELAQDYGRKIIPFMHILKIGPYGPVKERYGDKIDEAVSEWNDYYARSEKVMDGLCIEEFGKHYKEISRPNIIEDIIANA